MTYSPEKIAILAELLNLMMEPTPEFTSDAKNAVITLHADARFVPLDPDGTGVVCIPSIGLHTLDDVKPNQAEAWEHTLDKLSTHDE